MKKRLFAILLAAVMVMALLPVTATANPSSATVYLGGHEMTVSNNRLYAVTDSSGNVSAGTSSNYNIKLDTTSDIPILTLNNATIAATGAGGSTAEYFSGIHSSADLIVELVGTNTVTGAKLSGTAYGIQAPGKTLTICGGGSLTVRAHNAATPTNAYGIEAGTVNIESGTVSIDGDGTSGQGISVTTQLNVNGGYVTISGGSQAASVAPTLGTDVTVTAASVNTTDVGAVAYNSADIATYRYLKLDYLPAPAGSGTEADPYQLATFNDLKWFARQVNARQYTLCAKLTADITAQSGVLDSNGDLNGTPSVIWTPIGGFKGTFDGDGHTISGLYYSDSSVINVGLFSGVDRAKILNLGVVDSYFEGKDSVAGICGLINETTIEGCWSAATVKCKFNGGGICGLSYESDYDGSKPTKINNCYNLGKITQIGSTDGSVGGVIGKLFGGKLRNCHQFGSATSGGAERGVFGDVNSGTVKNIFARHATNDSGNWAVASRFASGEICYLLNNQGDSDAQLATPVWYQTIGTDNYPVLDSTHGTVYRAGSEGSYSYSNTEPHSHDMSAACGYYNEIDFVELKVGDLASDASNYKVLPTGNYYLSDNVDLGNVGGTAYSGLSIPAGATVNLCLNGYALKGPGQEGYYGMITVDDTAALNICDCRPTATTHTITDPVSGETKTVKGGLITGVNSTDARIVRVNILVNGTMKMYGGTIAGNKVRNYGAGLYVSSSGTFEMHGGAITCNAVVTDDSSYSGHGAGVEFEGANFALSGAAKITGNAFNGTPNNVYLCEGKTITVSAPLTIGASFGVTVQTAPTASLPVAITDSGSYDFSSYFTSDNSDYSIFNSGSGKIQVVQLACAHEHDMSVTCGHDADVTFTAWISDSGLPAKAGHYYLMKDVTLPNCWTPPSGTIDICLNGHTIKMDESSAFDPIDMTVATTLSICDCQTVQGTITANSGNKYGLVNINHASAILNLYGGKLTGGRSTSDAYDYGGYPGGGVSIFAQSGGTFNMYGGEISGNTGHFGGGVRVEAGTFNLYGGTIKNNTVTGDDKNGGGVWVINGTMNVSGAPKVTGNKKGTAANNVYLSPSKYITVSTGSPLTTGAFIGVTTQNTPTASGIQITNGDDVSTNLTDFFTADNSSYEAYIPSEGFVYIRPVSTPTVDTTAPSLSSAALDSGGKLVLTFSEAIDTTTSGKAIVISMNSDYTSPLSFTANSAKTVFTSPSAAAAGTYYINAYDLAGNQAALTADVYSISFNSNGGSGTMTAATAVSGSYTLPSCTFTAPDGKQFAGWATSASGTVISGTTTTISANTTLFAIWEDIPPAPTYTAPATYSADVPKAPENGKVDVSVKAAARNATVTVTVTPDPKYKTDKVVITDRNGNEIEFTEEDGKYTFKMPASKVEIQATFVWDNPFADVAEDAWYHDQVEYCHVNDLMDGVADDAFAPDSHLSRAMMVQLLYNKEQKPAVDSDLAFTDLEDGAWYQDAVLWAASKDIVTGDGDGSFRPDDDITREGLAVTLWRYADEPAVERDDLLGRFVDRDRISGYAETALQWAVDRGIIQGRPGNVLDPLAHATRAEMAALLNRYLALGE